MEECRLTAPRYRPPKATAIIYCQDGTHIDATREHGRATGDTNLWEETGA